MLCRHGFVSYYRLAKPPKAGLREPLVAPRTTGVGTAATPPALASFEPPELARELVVLSADAQAARTQAGGCSGSSERGEGTGGAGRCEMRQRRRCAPPAPAPFRAPAPRAQISTDAPTAAQLHTLSTPRRSAEAMGRHGPPSAKACAPPPPPRAPRFCSARAHRARALRGSLATAGDMAIMLALVEV